MFEEKQLTVRELVDGVIPCITAKNYSDNYVRGFRCIFNRLISYCDERNVEYFTTELAQQFVFDCYHVQPGTIERRCSRVHRAMDPLFVNPQGKALTRSGVSYILSKYISRVNETTLMPMPEITPHCLRHSKAMHLVEAGKNLVYIRDFLGHESIETTQIYAKANPESRRQALETVNRKLPTPDMNDWNDDPELTSFLNGL